MGFTINSNKTTLEKKSDDTYDLKVLFDTVDKKGNIIKTYNMVIENAKLTDEQIELINNNKDKMLRYDIVNNSEIHISYTK